MAALRVLVVFLLCSAAASARAAVLFTADFETDAPMLNGTPAGWSVRDGSVDIAGPGLDAYLCAGSGTCVDLDGSTHDAGVFERWFPLSAGAAYRLSFDLAGNRRLSGPESGRVTFGAAQLDYLLQDSVTSYQLFRLDFTPTSSDMFVLRFANDGNDQGGAILDNVRIESTAVPAPNVGVAFAFAVVGVALIGRRPVLKRAAAAAARG